MLSRVAAALTAILLGPTVDADEWFGRCGRAMGTLVGDAAKQGSEPTVRIGAWSPSQGWIGSHSLSESSTYGVGLLTSEYVNSLVSDRVFARRDVVDDAAWASSKLARSRAAEGFGEFVEGHFGAPWIGGRCVLFLTADCRAGGDRAGTIEWDERRIITVFSCLGPAVRDGFVHSVAVPAKWRAAVLARLSSSQRSILERLVEGKTEREIAEKLVRSPHTVHDHVKAIYTALGVSSRHELASLWNGRSKRGLPEVLNETVRP